MTRYTSPDLSRQLAEAGLLVDGGRDPRWWNQNPNLPGWCCDSWQYTPSGQGYKSVRALRLDEVLEELTRDREGGPLCGGDLSMNWLPFVPAGDWQVICAGWHETSDSAVEAAGLVLLALLRERGGK